jgi:hypothetical protein
MTFCGRRKKSTVRDFSTPILRKSAKKWFIGIYRKTAPTKSTVLGGDPPLGRKHENYRKLWIFTVFGPSIQPEKPSPKSASTPYPPAEDPKKWKKWKFIEKYGFKLSLLMAQAIYHYAISTIGIFKIKDI